MIKVKFSLRAFQKLKLYIENVDDEVSGLGYVKARGQTLHVYDIILLPQEVSAASTTLFQKSIAKYLDNRMKLNLPIEDIRVWWHSHGSMGASWSFIDEDTIKDFDTERDDNNWILSIVGDQLGEFKVRLDIFQPFKITLDDLEWNIDFTAGPELKKAIKQEIDEKVQSIKPILPIPFLRGKKKKKKKKWGKKHRRPLYDHRGQRMN